MAFSMYPYLEFTAKIYSAILYGGLFFITFSRTLSILSIIYKLFSMVILIIFVLSNKPYSSRIFDIFSMSSSEL